MIEKKRVMKSQRNCNYSEKSWVVVNFWVRLQENQWKSSQQHVSTILHSCPHYMLMCWCYKFPMFTDLFTSSMSVLMQILLQCHNQLCTSEVNGCTWRTTSNAFYVIDILRLVCQQCYLSMLDRNNLYTHGNVGVDIPQTFHLFLLKSPQLQHNWIYY